MLSYKKHRYYINMPMLLRVIGYLLVIESLFMLIPCIIALIYGEDSFMDFLICAGISGACGGGMMMLKPKTKEMGKKRGYSAYRNDMGHIVVVRNASFSFRRHSSLGFRRFF